MSTPLYFLLVFDSVFWPRIIIAHGSHSFDHEIFWPRVFFDHEFFWTRISRITRIYLVRGSFLYTHTDLTDLTDFLTTRSFDHEFFWTRIIRITRIILLSQVFIKNSFNSCSKIPCKKSVFKNIRVIRVIRVQKNLV